MVQLRINAAPPATQTFRASHSLYPTTLGGEIEPTQRAALCHVRIACGLFTLIVLSSSMIRPPPSAPLPFQPVACQSFGSAPLPYKAPKLFLTFGSFACLNPGRHTLQFIP